MLVEDETVEATLDWVAAVDDALQESIDRHGLDPERLLDEHTTEGAAFLGKLNALVDSDPDDPAFARAVEATAIEVANERVTESGHTAEDVETIQGRVLEAKGTAPDGGRIFRVQILRAGESKNGNVYTPDVIRRDAHLYEGAKAYDHHRTPAELQSSTLTGLVGSYRNVEAVSNGAVLEADLQLLPSATHTAEALDATIVQQAAGLKPIVGISHDVMASFRPSTGRNGRRVREAVAITSVQSADVVADPSAGGQAVRVVQGGIDPTTEQNQESEVHVSEALATLQNLTPEQLAAALGQLRTAESTIPSERVVENQRTVEGGQPKSSFMGKMLIKSKLEDAGLPVSVTESFTQGLPQHVTEADVDAAIANLKAQAAVLERSGLTPQHTAAVVTRESREKKVAALDAFFAGDFNKGYRSFRTAFLDITGHRPDFLGNEDLNRRIIRESYGQGYDSDVRTTESADTGTWAQLLGDSVTRRVVAEYATPTLQTWRTIVSDIQPIEDFRTQRVGRMGGYGVLPAVAQGQPYQPLTTPGDEEATYGITKRGGTEDLTMETIANDDRRVISKIPQKLGRAAAQTLYRFVWDMLTTPITCTYDGVVLLHSSHANTDTGSALSQSTLGIGRRKMRDQAAYGDTSEILGLQPRYLVVPNELEELAFQLCSSAVAVPSTAAGPSDTPNINSAQGLTPILVPYFTDADDWFLIADPNMVPTIEIGFYQGRQEPEIFTQSDPNVGSVFNADVFTWKIRHIYSGTALDHRGFYRGQG